MSKVLVTGAAGFVGRALANTLRAAGHEVIELERRNGDIAEPATWAGVPAVAHVFHLAGKSFIPESWRDPAGFMQANVTGTTRALEYCRATGAHLVFTSTAIFGAPKRLPVREDDTVTPNNPYALTKFLAEGACAFYASILDVPVSVIRLANVFGPGQRPEFLIPTIIDHVRRCQNIRVKTLSPRRDFLFLDDAVSALIHAMARPPGLRVINIGSGTSHSVREVTDIIQAAAGTRLPVVSDEELRPHEVAEVSVDITRARELLGWTPRHSLAEGIARMLQLVQPAPRA